MCAFIHRNHRITEQVMVGTHGSLKNLYSKRVLKFQSVRIVVFDEADEMLKVGGSLSVQLIAHAVLDCMHVICPALVLSHAMVRA